MSERVTMPALGESVTEGTVTRWLKNVGDQVAVDEPLLEVSTDKVDTEIPSPVAGTLQEILAEEDETVAVGADLAVISDGPADGGDDAAPAEEPAEAPAAEAAPAAEDSSGDSSDGDAIDSPDDRDEVAAAGDEGGQEPASPHTEAPAESESGSSDSASAESAPAAPSGGGGGGGGTTVTMPALGESVTEGTITRWLKAEGDEVAVDEPLLEVSTDKVDTEIPSPVAGTLSKILVQEDETVPVGADLAVVGGDADGADAAASDNTDTSQAAAPAQPTAEEAAPEPEAASPGQSAEPEATQPVEQPKQQEQPKQASEKPADTASGQPTQAQSVAPDEPAPSEGEVAQATAPAPKAAGSDEAQDASAYVTPLVRKIANENGIDLASVKGTGVGGRIRKQDVLAAAEAAKAPAETPEAAPAASATTAAPAPSSTGKSAAVDTSLRGTTQPMTRLRKVIAKRMVESLQTSAQLTTVVEVDVTKIARLRDRAKGDFARREGTKLSFLPFFTLAAIEALKVHPTVNASIDGDTVIYHGSENVGMAVDTDKGLLVPVVKNAGDLNIAGLSRNIADLAERTRTNKITPDDLAGGTFTITNTGSRGALFDTPIINQPQVAILGTGAVVKRPVVVSDSDGGETIAIRSMVYLALSYDHRIVDGADAARFLTTVKERLEEGAFEADLGL
ncbi:MULTISPECIES: 2-oxoglutarate dehydrogenase, E2 component, dihydrolipoamide succinyltransferase [unclassified Knoellia]|uniref:2-oxoglutarate dehydrogenase, E2 component, dihydrolipoamide succinyltransferase n=1 Tax=Knoellia altitudinis TaxID=3404795 RepID=UPI00361BAC4E